MLKQQNKSYLGPFGIRYRKQKNIAWCILFLLYSDAHLCLRLIDLLKINIRESMTQCSEFVQPACDEFTKDD